ncbi:MAG TPA: biotin--[acetyl-CoA-carboxylase] ligase, partial [Candidatus Acidoferrales bacterium]|nr:biotin--[acetyl-CoA-carboxylase] ligase [Candidatus Acidoferrales bacterium]
MAAVEHPYASVERELRGTAFSHIRYEQSTASTNDDAAALLGDPAAAGLTIVAEVQTRGAGRKGRSWIASPGSALLMTTIAPHAVPTANVWVVPFGIALGVRRALLQSGVRTELHWPNDLLAGGKKIAGILCVSRVLGEHTYVASGIGINVYRTPDADAAIDPPPAFCNDFNPSVDRAVLLRDILINYDVWFSTLAMPQRIARVWERLAGLPKPYTILKDGATGPV